jgi:hypothetical protein
MIPETHRSWQRDSKQGHVRRFWAALTALALPFAAAACIPAPPPPLSPVEEAASYDWLIAERHYAEPLNAWVRNKQLERFLLKTYTSGGLDALKSQYGFECILRAIIPPCGNCYVCRGNMAPRLAEQDANLGARDAGRMLMQVDIGPGSESFSAMTYWERPPLPPKAGK